MFDDIPTTSAKGTVPNDLPIGSVEDMFDGNAEPVASSIASAEAPMENTDGSMPIQPLTPNVTGASAVSAGVLKPKVAVPTPQQNYDKNLDTLMTPEMSDVTPPRGSKIVFVIIIAILGIGVLSGISWAVYHFFFAPKVEVVPIVEEQKTPNTVDVTAPATVETEITPAVDANEVTQDQKESEILFGAPIDTDDDQLDDDIEVSIGTDPQNFDTDNDGLSDGDEVLVWKTNPLNPDTDGDTYKDGDEIKAGYSPLGPGKLFVTPSSTTTTVSSTN